jgi:uncharacterized protein YjbI with pentapeptide repeats
MMKLSQLTELIRKAHANNEPFALIANVDLPAIHLAPKYPFLPIHLKFDRVHFHGEIELEKIVFPVGASFVGCVFEEKVSFSSCHFNGPAYFWKCKFLKEAKFPNMVVTRANYPGSDLYPGETNFSYSEFTGRAHFSRAVFHGPAFFHRTMFGGSVNFEVARFEEGALFASVLQDICISDRDLAPGVAERLCQPECQPEVLIAGDTHKRGYYNFDPCINTEEELRGKLGHRVTRPPRMLARIMPRLPKRRRGSIKAEPQPLLSAQDEAAVVELWKKYRYKYLFNNKYEQNFIETYFGPSTFRHISLRKCLLRRADISKVHLEGVLWANTAKISFVLAKIRHVLTKKFPVLAKIRPVLTKIPPIRAEIPFMKRDGIYDEIHLREPLQWALLARRLSWKAIDRRGKERHAVSAVYHQLKFVADSSGERSLARHFYFGEMEMARLAVPPWTRSPLALLYKLLSGYGTKENRALLILLLIVFVLFPVGYWGLDTVSGAAKSRTTHSEIFSTETTSLEACTFLLRAANQPASPVDNRLRFVEGVERISASIQATLFVLALKSRFQPAPE